MTTAYDDDLDRELAMDRELERQERVACVQLAIIFRSRFDAKCREIHSAEIVEADCPDVVVFDQFNDTDDLEHLISQARSKRDELANEIAKRAMRDI